MNECFRKMVESLEEKLQEMLRMMPEKYGMLSRNLPKRAIYLFSEHGKHLYVGRTNNLRQRLRDHCVPSGDHYTATFAFRIARMQTGKLKATYRKAGSREALLKDREFRPEFENAKRRVMEMEIRYVEETDPTRQALLEIYAATVLQTPFNDFDTH